jgi:hypothetical protein
MSTDNELVKKIANILNKVDSPTAVPLDPVHQLSPKHGEFQISDFKFQIDPPYVFWAVCFGVEEMPV